MKVAWGDRNLDANTMRSMPSFLSSTTNQNQNQFTQIPNSHLLNQFHHQILLQHTIIHSFFLPSQTIKMSQTIQHPPLATPYPAPTTTTTTTTYPPQPINPHYLPQPIPPPPPPSPTLTTICRSFQTATRRTESLISDIYTHFRTAGPTLPDAAASTLTHGAKLLSEGGPDGSFRLNFGTLLPDEHLRGAYACYLSTTAGPVMGTLFVSNRRIAFSSDYPVRGVGGGSGNPGVKVEWKCYYRVVLMVEEVATVNCSVSRFNTREKYVQVLCKDGREFWFLGFILYDKAVRCLRGGLHHGY